MLLYPALRLSVHSSELRWGPSKLLFLVRIGSKLRRKLLRMLLRMLLVLQSVLGRRRWKVEIVSLQEGVHVVVFVLLVRYRQMLVRRLALAPLLRRLELVGIDVTGRLIVFWR